MASRAPVTAMNSITNADSAWIDAPFSIRMAMTLFLQLGAVCLRTMAAVARRVLGAVVRKTVSRGVRVFFQEPSVYSRLAGVYSAAIAWIAVDQESLMGRV